MQAVVNMSAHHSEKLMRKKMLNDNAAGSGRGRSGPRGRAVQEP